MSEWKERRLEDIVQLKRGFDLATRDRRPGSFPVVGSAGISGWHDEGPIPGPALVLGRAGASMGVASFCETERFWPLNTALFVEDFKGNDPRFIFHLFQVTDLTGFNSGSVQPMLNRNYIRNVIVRIPDLGEQQAISGMLKALDDKISVNNGIRTSASDLISTLYEQALDWSEPMAVPLAEAVDFDFGLPFSSDSFNDQELGLPLLRIRDIKSFSPQVWTTERIIRDVVVTPGDVVAGMDAEFRPSFWLGKPALLNQRVLRGRSAIAEGGLSFVREVLKKPLSEIEGYKTGTTVIHLNKRDLALSVAEIPGPEALAAFGAAAEPLRCRIVTAAEESRALAQLRDTLLPKLMSGKIRVRDAEKVIEDVTL